MGHGPSSLFALLSLLSKTLSFSLVTKLYLGCCNSIDCGLPGSSVHGIPQARTLECIAISFSRGSSWSRNWAWVSYIAGSLFTGCRLFTCWGKPSKTLTKAKPVIYVARIYQNIKYPLFSISSDDSSSELAKPVGTYYSWGRTFVSFTALSPTPKMESGIYHGVITYALNK